MGLLEEPSAATLATDARRVAAVSRRELERRWALVRDRLKDRGIDTLVAVGTDADLSGTTRWLTDAPVTYRKVVAVHADDLMTVVDHGGQGQVRASDGADPTYPGAGEIITVSEFSSVGYTQAYEADALCAALKRRGCRSIALVNVAAMPSRFLTTLTDQMGEHVAFHDETAFIDRVKAIKSAEEIALVEDGARLQDAVFAATAAFIRPGLRDYEISAFATYEARRRGGDNGIIMFGSAPAGAEPAMMRTAHRGNRMVEQGDAVTLLVENGSPAGYFLELGRNLSIGPAHPRQRDLHALLLAAKEHSHRLLVPGARARDVYAAHNAFMVANGLHPEARLYAHGQGYDLIERPLIRDDEDMVIEAGMCLTIHPGGVTNGYFGFVCDNVVVEATGVRDLHATERKLFEL